MDDIVRFQVAMIAVGLYVVVVWRWRASPMGIGPEVSLTGLPHSTDGTSRGRLTHGNRTGDPSTARRCSARTLLNHPYQALAVRGKRRCRMLGGRSTVRRRRMRRAQRLRVDVKTLATLQKMRKSSATDPHRGI